MSNLLASLTTSGNSLDVFQRALGVVQNNVDNASTPGYATQQAALTALPMDIAGGLAGGVATSGLDSARNEFAEDAVRSQAESLGRLTTLSQGLSQLESLFDISGTSGIPSDLNQLMQAFSAWSVNPNDPTARQTVIDRAGTLADSVQELAESINRVAGSLDQTIGSTVQQINALTGAIQSYNLEHATGSNPDPAADAALHSNLESLAELINITTLQQSDGTLTVLAGDGTPLVIGDQQYSLIAGVAAASAGASNPLGPPSSQIRNAQGIDITSVLSGGQLGGLLDVRNRVIPSVVGDGMQAGSLNTFAKSLADSINQILQSGRVSSDAAAAPGAALFTYDNTDATWIAGSLRVNPAISIAQLAPVDSAGTANGNALLLATLGSARQSSLGNLSFSSFLTGIAANVGSESKGAKSDLDAQKQATAQTRSLRDQISGVSLDAEAVKIIEFQRGYQAVARVINILSQLTDATIQMIP